MNDEETTNEDYEHAEIVWKQFGIRTLGEYTSLYNKVDVLQLADVFENFRDICLEIRPRLVLYFARSRLGCYAEKNWYYFRTVD